MRFLKIEFRHLILLYNLRMFVNNLLILLFCHITMSNSFLNTLLQDLSSKSFLNKETPHFGNGGVTISQINVLGLGLREDQLKSDLFGGCTEIKRIIDRSGLDRTLWKCGDVSLLNCENNYGSLDMLSIEKREEAKQMINTGKLNWGEPVQEASVFGYYLGRHWWYWNDYISYKNKPHVVIKNDDQNYNLVPNNVPVVDANIHGVAQARRQLKHQYTVNHVNHMSQVHYNRGYSAGNRDSSESATEAYQRGFASGKLTCNQIAVDRIVYVNSATSNTNSTSNKTQSNYETQKLVDDVLRNSTESAKKLQSEIAACNKSLATCRETNDKAYMNGFAEAERMYKK